MNWSAASRPHPEAFWLIALAPTGRSAQRSQLIHFPRRVLWVVGTNCPTRSANGFGKPEHSPWPATTPILISGS